MAIVQADDFRQRLVEQGAAPVGNTPEEFGDIKRHALGLGYLHVESGPLVRSSYRAGRLYKHWGGKIGAGSTGMGDNAIQAYNYRLCLTKNPDDRIAIVKSYLEAFGALDNVRIVGVCDIDLDRARATAEYEHTPLADGESVRLGRVLRELLPPGPVLDALLALMLRLLVVGELQRRASRPRQVAELEMVDGGGRAEEPLGGDAGQLVGDVEVLEVAGRTVRITSTRLVCFRQRAVMAIRYEVEAVEQLYAASY